MKIKTVFTIQAYEAMTPEGQLIDTIRLELFANSEKEAIKKAEGIVKRKFYRLSGVVEIVDDTK